ncbi:MAG: threonine ammonia-lyase [Acidobacteriota bacterium]
MPTIADIRAARERIAGTLPVTPCRQALGYGNLVPARLFLKLENLQRTGSFKERGALNRLLTMEEASRRRGVITASAGNHAQALALHASNLGIASTVVMPENTPLIKVTNTRRYGATVVLHGATFDDAVDHAHQLRKERDLVLVPAFNDEAVIAGQGTVALELAEQIDRIDTMVVPIGGGGLISGIALALKELMPDIRVVGVEAEAAPSAHASREAGEIVTVTSRDTIADGIAVKRVGELTFPLIERLVDDLVKVDDAEIATAILRLLENQKTLTEGAGAAGMAAILAGKVPMVEGETVAVVLCGGNIDINILARIIDRGLVSDGRVARLKVRGQDRPGLLAEVTATVAEHGANVLEITHAREFADISVGEVEVLLTLETRGENHIAEIIGALVDEGDRVQSLS